MIFLSQLSLRIVGYFAFFYKDGKRQNLLNALFFVWSLLCRHTSVALGLITGAQ